jgi:hypothetical protein
MRGKGGDGVDSEPVELRRQLSKANMLLEEKTEELESEIWPFDWTI